MKDRLGCADGTLTACLLAHNARQGQFTSHTTWVYTAKNHSHSQASLRAERLDVRTPILK